MSGALPLVVITLASLFWASAGTVAKLLFVTIDPFSLAFLRFAVAALVIAPFFFFHFSLWKVFHPFLLFIAFLSTLNIVFFYIALQWTTANAANVIYGAVPFLTALLSSVTIGERLTRRQWGGIIIGFVGTLTIVFLPLLERRDVFVGDVRGNLFVVLAALSWTGYTVGSRRLTARGDITPFVMSAVSIFLSVVLFSVTLLIVPHRPLVTAFASPTSFALLLYLAIVVTVGTYLLYQWTVKHASATIASLTNYIQPVVGLALNALILNEALTARLLLGTVLVLLGVLCATLSPRVQPQKII